MSFGRSRPGPAVPAGSGRLGQSSRHLVPARATAVDVARDRSRAPRYSLTVRLAITNRPGMLGRVAMRHRRRRRRHRRRRPGRVRARADRARHHDQGPGQRARPADRQPAASAWPASGSSTSPTARSSCTWAARSRSTTRCPIRTRDDLSMAYTPGVARVCLAIRDDRQRAFALTIKQNTVAVVTDGTAVLGPRRHRSRGGAAGDGRQGDALQGVRRRRRLPDLPGHQGRRTRSSRPSSCIAPGFGGVNLEDIAAPRCFEIEERLRKELDIPVFHDDQHGTAVVVLAALLNALRIVKKPLRSLRVVVTGVGAAGTATIKILQSSGVRDIVGVDEHGTIHRGRGQGHGLHEALGGGQRPTRGRSRGASATPCSGPTCSSACRSPASSRVRDVKRMARDPIVFAMANPVPEIQPEEAEQARPGDGDRPLRLSEPDQQRAVLPRLLPRPARQPARAP